MTQNNKHKRDSIKPIILNYSRKRNIVDITYLSNIFGAEYEYPYLLVVEEHFSKYAMAYPLHNKEAETVLKKIKEFCIYFGYQEEIGADNGKEFNNSSLNNFLNEHNIIMIHGRPYNPHFQGSV